MTGRPEAWQIIRSALEVLWSGGDQEADGGVGTAQQILDAGEITLPHGLISDAYDSLGNHYRLPAVVVSDPTNISYTPPSDIDEDTLLHTVADKEEDIDEEDDAAALRREAKGKAVIKAEDLIKVTARLSDTGRDLKIQHGKEESVRLFIQRLTAESGVRPFPGPE